MAERGINPKRWFYEFIKHLDQDAARAVLAGAAAEQWVNSEFFRYLAGVLPKNLTVYPEWDKKDLAIVRVNNGDPQWDIPAAGLMEVKLVYLNYPKEKRRLYIERLLDQLVACASLGVPSFGWLIAVHAYWNPRQPVETFAQLRESVGSQLREAASRRMNPHVVVAKPAMETLISQSTATIGGATAPVAAAWQYLVVR